MKETEIISQGFPLCPIRNVLGRITGKWSLLVLWALQEKHPIRFTELRKQIPDVSSKVLTETLRTLEEDGILSRRAYSEIPPRVEYDFTEVGRSLLPAYNSLIGWAKDCMPTIIESRKANKPT